MYTDSFSFNSKVVVPVTGSSVLKLNKLLASILIFFSAFLFFLSKSFAHPVAQGSMVIDVRDAGILLTMRASLEQVTVERGFNQGLNEVSSVGDQWVKHGDYILSRFHLFADGSEIPAHSIEKDPPYRDRSFVVFT